MARRDEAERGTAVEASQGLDQQCGERCDMARQAGSGTDSLCKTR